MRYLVGVMLVAFAACSPVRPVAPSPRSSVADSLAVFDREVRAGCLDCLTAAYAGYDALRDRADTRQTATVGAIRAAALIALRERELGMMDTGHLGAARGLAAGVDLPASVPMILDVVDALPAMRAVAMRPATTDADLERMRTLRQNREAWTSGLRHAARTDVASAYVWLAMACESLDTQTITAADVFDDVSAFAGVPLVQYRKALCRTTDAPILESLLLNEPRFVEITYSLGLANLGARPEPRLDAADDWFQRAYGWQPRWPTLTLTMAGVAMSGEDFQRARRLYDDTLAVQPRSGDALFGRLRAETYLGAADDAIRTADQMLAARWSVGDARYWKAYNELQLSRLDEAWRDVEEAARTLVDGQVPKLAGLIAYRQQQLEIAVARFGLAYERNPNDCETQFYLGLVHADLRQWADTANVLTAAAACLQDAETQIAAEIERIRASTTSEERKAQQIARREGQIAQIRRRVAASWFDIAVADLSLSKPADARRYAEKVSDDEQYGARAKEILSRIPPDDF